MFSSKAGLIRNPARTNIIRFLGYEQPHTAGSLASPTATVGPNVGLPWAATTGRPVYAFDLNADNTPLSSSFINDTTVGGRWQVQLGLRYIF